MKENNNFVSSTFCKFKTFLSVLTVFITKQNEKNIKYPGTFDYFYLQSLEKSFFENILKHSQEARDEILNFRIKLFLQEIETYL